MSQATGGTAVFTDEDLRAALFRAVKLTAILGLVLASVLLPTAGWQTAVLALIGAVVSASGIWEWQKLIVVVNSRMDLAAALASFTAAPPGAPGMEEPVPAQVASEPVEIEETGPEPAKSGPPVRVVGMFLLRLALSALVIYVSLKCLHGSALALVGGLALAVVGLTIEAVRLLLPR